ncbi:hypothetical protein, partial [Microbispora siamensis]|uniref:hypothetical protein n=1 Tax=Microbispora siamensis TaxID=564413 RepID=UPI00194EE538
MDLFDPNADRPRRTNKTDDGWWDRLIADSPLWSSEGSAAREHASQDPSEGASGADSVGRDKARSSWVLVGSLRESAQA